MQIFLSPSIMNICRNIYHTLLPVDRIFRYISPPVKLGFVFVYKSSLQLPDQCRSQEGSFSILSFFSAYVLCVEMIDLDTCFVKGGYIRDLCCRQEFISFGLPLVVLARVALPRVQL